jgi:hypothetical protein
VSSSITSHPIHSSTKGRRLSESKRLSDWDTEDEDDDDDEEEDEDDVHEDDDDDEDDDDEEDEDEAAPEAYSSLIRLLLL